MQCCEANEKCYRLTAGGPYTLSSALAMCQTCHSNTPSYGVSSLKPIHLFPQGGLDISDGLTNICPLGTT